MIKENPHILEKMLLWHKTEQSREIKSRLIKAYFSNPDNKERIALHKLKTNLARNPRKGADSHLWKGGLSTENQILRNSANYSEWRKKVFLRDNYTCKKCGARKNLTAHHIKEWASYRELRFEISNGLTLCLNCHSSVHSRHLHNKGCLYICENCKGRKKCRASKYCRPCSDKIATTCALCGDGKSRRFKFCRKCLKENYSMITLDDKIISDENLEFYDPPEKIWVRVQDAVKMICDGNPKRHDFGALIQSIKKYGFQEPAKYDKSIGIKSGNGRIEAVANMEREGKHKLPRGLAKDKRSGEWCMPLLVGTDARSKHEAMGYLVDANNLTMLGGDFDMLEIGKMWEGDAYAKLLQDLQAAEMPPVSMDDGDITAFLRTMDAEKLPEGDDDEHAGELVDKAEELQTKWQVVSGDIWQIGEHFIICGDCTNFNNWQKLLKVASVEKVNGVFTSPPYAEQRKKQYGGIPTEKYVDWWYDVQANVRAHLAEDGSFFVNIKPHCENGERVLYVFDLVLAMQRQWKWKFIDEFCWKKTGYPGKFERRFKNAFEPIYHFSCCVEIKSRIENVFESRYSKVTATWEPLPETQGKGGTIKGRSVSNIAPDNVLEVAFDATGLQADGHSGRFPVALPEFFIKAYSDENDIWLDPFLGSGTTIITAHRNKRLGLGIEKLEKYVAVCLERISKETGKTPQRIEANA